MESDCKYLFVYGSLLDHNNTYAALLQSSSRFIIAGNFNGLLYDIGQYPGALYHATAQAQVFGHILWLDNPAETLEIIDEYEGYGPKHPQPNEFIRTIIPVHTASGILNCYVYLYNLPVAGYQQIHSGKYRT